MSHQHLVQIKILAIIIRNLPKRKKKKTSSIWEPIPLRVANWSLGPIRVSWAAKSTKDIWILPCPTPRRVAMIVCCFHPSLRIEAERRDEPRSPITSLKSPRVKLAVPPAPARRLPLTTIPIARTATPEEPRAWPSLTASNQTTTMIQMNRFSSLNLSIMKCAAKPPRAAP